VDAQFMRCTSGVLTVSHEVRGAHMDVVLRALAAFIETGMEEAVLRIPIGGGNYACYPVSREGIWNFLREKHYQETP